MLALIAVLLVAFCNLFLGVIVLLKNRGNFINTSFGIFAFTMAVWLACNFYSNDSSFSTELLMWLNRATLFLSGMGLYFLLLFSLEFTRFGYKRFRPFALIFGFVTLLVSFLSTTPMVLAGLDFRKNLVAVKFGPLTPLFTIFIVGLFFGIIAIFLGSLRHLHGNAKARTKIMTASLFITISVLVLTNLILPEFYDNFSFITIGLLSTIIMVGGFSYAIVKLRLFDIRAIVARSIAYLLLLITMGIAYGFITFRLGQVLFAHTQVTTPQQTFNVLSALVLALTFQPLKRLFEKVTDNIFYRNHYDPEELMDEFSRVLSSEIDLIQLTRKVRSLLVAHLRVEHIDIVVLDDEKVFLETGHYPVGQLQALGRDLGELRGKLLVTDEEPEGRRKEVLQEYGINVMAVLRTHDEKVGYLLFGEKLNGDIYTGLDLRIVPIIADQLAIAIQNAKSYLEIQRFNRTLQVKVDDATKQLREANNSLHQLDEVKDEFISMASHQLRTPMTVIDGYLANLLAGIYGEFNDRQRKAMTFAQNRVRLTSGLVADLLNLSRMEAGRFFIDATPVELERLVEDEVEQLKMKADQQGVSLGYQPPLTPMPTLVIDEQKTRQVIMNLIDNAINYTPKGAVKVTLEVAGNQALFKVIDNGIGVPESEQAKLFNKFYRASNAKLERADGTGIGLFLVKRVIEQQGGTLIFTSKVGTGSTFGFRLPINTEPIERQGTSPIPAAVPATASQMPARDAAAEKPIMVS